MSSISERKIGKETACNKLREAINDGKIGDMLEKLEALIMEYYQDVQEQADESFRAARTFAALGFVILVLTWAYVLIFDALARWKIPSAAAADALTVGVGTIGTVSGVLIEFIAAIAFWLYARAARQFGAFHICLERTHRYLIAYKIADGMKEHKDATFRDLVCIMANASTITRADIEAVGSHEGKVSAAFSRAPVAAATRDRG